MPRIICGNGGFEYEVIRKNKKNIGITIKPDGRVLVTSPFYVKDEDLNEVVEKKTKWIMDKLKVVNEINREIEEREFKNGETIDYLGKNYIINVVEKNIKGVRIAFSKDELKIEMDSGLLKNERRETIGAALTKWFKEEAKIRLRERTELYGKKLNLIPNRILVKDQKTMWGSCSNRGNINYNWRLIMAPLEVMDYVVVHELCHLKQPNHSSKFWDLVGHAIPDYKERRKWLRDNSRRLMYRI